MLKRRSDHADGCSSRAVRILLRFPDGSLLPSEMELPLNQPLPTCIQLPVIEAFARLFPQAPGLQIGAVNFTLQRVTHADHFGAVEALYA